MTEDSYPRDIIGYGRNPPDRVGRAAPTRPSSSC